MPRQNEFGIPLDTDKGIRIANLRIGNLLCEVFGDFLHAHKAPNFVGLNITGQQRR